MDFNQAQLDWWDPEGPLKTLHHINPIRLAYIKNYINLQGRKILDIGCGGGLLSEALAAEGAQVTGLDLAPEAIKVAQQHDTYGINYIAGDIKTLDQSNFDLITCLELLEHVEEPIDVLEQATQRLKPGGILFLSTINRTPTAYFKAILAAEYILGIVPKQTHDYQLFIKPSELDAWCRGLNLALMNLSGIAYNPFTQQARLNKNVSVNYIACYRQTT